MRLRFQRHSVFLAHSDFNAEIMGLKAVPPEDRPPVAIVHFRVSDYGRVWDGSDYHWYPRWLAGVETQKPARSTLVSAVGHVLCTTWVYRH